ncbi:MAG: glycosyltransferase, partial [Gammaproteobacteria bacterium]
MKDRILLLASLASSLVVFRGALIQALIDQGLEVHVAAPDLLKDPSAEVLRDKGVILHDIPLRRAGMNPVSDFSSFLAINSLLRTIRPKYFLGYTVKPVIYGLLAARLAGVSRRFALITGLGYAFTGNAKGKRALAQMLVRSLY